MTLLKSLLENNPTEWEVVFFPNRDDAKAGKNKEKLGKHKTKPDAAKAVEELKVKKPGVYTIQPTDPFHGL